MGSDLAIVDVEDYREWTRREAASRMLAYGLPDAEKDVFFTEEGPWLELRIRLRCVHPDAPLDWGPLFLTRLLDEGVYHAARSDDSGFDFEKTPLTARYPTLWQMSGTRIEQEKDSLIRVVEVRFEKTANPREGRREDPVGDRLTVALFVHKKHAPNLADMGAWESRAWGGGEYFARDWPASRHPLLAEIRALTPSLRASLSRADKVLESAGFTAVAPRGGGGLWVATSSRLYTIPPGSRGEAEKVLDVAAEHACSGIKSLAAAPDGSLWILAHQAVLQRREDGSCRVFHRDENGFGKKLHALAVSPDGLVATGTEKGLHVLGPDGAWTTVQDGLSDRVVERLLALRGGVVWARGPQKLTRRNADGSLERFLSRQGIDSARALIPLPSGGLWVTAWNGLTTHVGPGAAQGAPDDLAASVAPGGLAAGTVGPDATLWCATLRGHLLRLREGEPPRAYVWPGAENPMWGVQAELCVTAEGNVWLRAPDGTVTGIAAADLAAADSAPALNATIPGRGQFAPVVFGPPAPPPAAAAPAIDFKGKTVVITGTLSKLTRDEAHRVLGQRGAVISESVNKKTSYLLCGLKPSSKLQKAQSLGIPVLTEDVLLAPAAAAPPAAAATPESPAPATPESAPAPAATPESPATIESTAQPPSALVLARFPLSDRPASTASKIDAAMMRAMAHDREPLTLKEWKKMLKEHKLFLDEGGGGGTWHVLETSGLLLAVRQGYQPPKGTPADLYLKRLPDGFDARKAKLPWMNALGVFARAADFCGANLANGLFCDAALERARFEAADLSGCDFSRADLRGASFRNAVLAKADFEDANLEGADFTGARVEDARFPGARLAGVAF